MNKNILENTVFILSIYNRNKSSVGEYVCYKHIKKIEDTFSKPTIVEKSCFNINSLISNKTKFIIFGGIEELRRLETLGLDVENIQNLIDLQDVCWINNSEYTNPSIEYCIKELLNKDYPNEYNLSRYSFINDKEQTTILNELLNDFIRIYVLSYKQCFEKNVYKIDSNLIKTLLVIENREKPVDIDYLKLLKKEFESKIKSIEEEIYLLRDRKININSMKDISDILEDYGIDFLNKTKTGLLKNSNDILNVAYSYTKADILNKIIQYRKYKSNYTNFLLPLFEFINKNNSRGCRFCYRPYSIQTGRIGTSKLKDSDFYTQISIQTVPKENTKIYYKYNINDFKDIKFNNVDTIINSIKLKLENTVILDKKINNDIPFLETKGFEQENNIRKCFIPNKNCYWVSIDYKSQEINVVTKLYNDVELSSSFKKNDVYTSIGNKILKEFNLKTNLSNQEFRNKIKTIILGIIYGMNIKSVIKNIHSLSEQEIKLSELEYLKEERKLKTVFRKIIDGQSRTLKSYYSVHKCYSMFNRPRSITIEKTDNSSTKKTKERKILNMPIQGTCADIMRIVLTRIENEITNQYKYYGFDIMNSIHDEINFSIPKLYYKEIIKKILEIMKNPVNFIDFNLDCSIYIGNSWGELFQFSETELNNSIDF